MALPTAKDVKPENNNLRGNVAKDTTKKRHVSSSEVFQRDPNERRRTIEQFVPNIQRRTISGQLEDPTQPQGLDYLTAHDKTGGHSWNQPEHPTMMQTPMDRDALAKITEDTLHPTQRVASEGHQAVQSPFGVATNAPVVSLVKDAERGLNPANPLNMAERNAHHVALQSVFNSMRQNADPTQPAPSGPMSPFRLDQPQQGAPPYETPALTHAQHAHPAQAAPALTTASVSSGSSHMDLPTLHTSDALLPRLARTAMTAGATGLDALNNTFWDSHSGNPAQKAISPFVNRPGPAPAPSTPTRAALLSPHAHQARQAERDRIIGESHFNARQIGDDFSPVVGQPEGNPREMSNIDRMFSPSRHQNDPNLEPPPADPKTLALLAHIISRYF